MSQLCMPGRKSGHEAMAMISPGLSPASIMTIATRASPWSGGSVASVFAGLMRRRLAPLSSRAPIFA
jgi:hypothetical protein